MALYLPAGNPLSHRDVTKRLLIVVDEQGMVALLREFFCHFTRQPSYGAKSSISFFWVFKCH